VMGGKTICPLAQIMIWESVAFMAATFVRMVWAYANPPFGTCARRVVVVVYANVLNLHVLFLLFVTCIFFAWFVLSAVLSPGRYLPYGTALVVLAVTMQQIGHELVLQGQRAASQALKIIKQNLARKLRRAREQIELTAYERLVRENALDGNDGDDGKDFDNDFDAPLGPRRPGEGHDEPDGAAPKSVEAADIFAVLKEARDAELADDEQVAIGKADATDVDPDQLSRADFARLFKTLDLNFTDAQIERLFTMTDLDGSGKVTLVEFEGAWELLLKELVADSVSDMGLSGSQILAAVAAVFLALALLFAFLLVVLSCWLNEDNFSSVAQSTLVGAIGRAVYSLRRRAKESKNEELDQAVALVIGERAAANEEDEPEE